MRLEDSTVGYERSFTLSRGDKQAKFSLFGWDLTADGTTTKLARPVFPCRGEVYVPLRELASALGLRFTLR